ncbi:MAG: hypothetical protein QOH84_5001, partial [Kribbellaceae bacterium]|nr:hypothetical protein [Kribbellaceae bacterium]
AYGTSTRLTSPWRTTKFTASSVPNRQPTSRNTPLAARSPIYASIASNSACGGVPTPSSIHTNPMNRGILITPVSCWSVASRTYVERLRGFSTSTIEVFRRGNLDRHDHAYLHVMEKGLRCATRLPSCQ